MSDAPERIWAVTEPNDISADILGEVYAQQIPDGMNGTPVEYVRADRIEQLAAINEELIAERDEAWKRAGHAEMMWGKAEAKLSESEALLAKTVEIGNKMAHSIEGNYYLPNIAGEWRKVAAEIKGGKGE